jgi:hypothetical protein
MKVGLSWDTPLRSLAQATVDEGLVPHPTFGGFCYAASRANETEISRSVY